MTATTIDGKAFAATVRGQVAEHVARLKADHGITPGLAVILVGEDPASEVYVAAKHRQTVEVGMASFEHRLPADVSEDTLFALIDDLNADAGVHGSNVTNVRASVVAVHHATRCCAVESWR